MTEIINENTTPATCSNGKGFFGKMIIPCLIYACLFTFCLYKNITGITVPFCISGIIALVMYTLKRYSMKSKKGSLFVIAVMLIIAFSSFLTGNKSIQILNICALFLLTVHLVLMNFADTTKWDFGKHLGEIFSAVFASLGFITSPVSEAAEYVRATSDSNRKRNNRQVLTGLAIAFPCLVILCLLLSSADMVFANMFTVLFKKIRLTKKFFEILFITLFAFLSAYCGLHYAVSKGNAITVADHRRSEPITAITVTSLISLVYLVFSVIQIMYLFIGRFALPEGITYAAYARKGFFQLLFVCILNIILVLAMKKYILRSRILDVILIIICACTYIMIASSACRMVMYIREYKLTLLRVMVLFALATIFLLMAGVIISIINESFSFFRYGFVVICVVYTLFALSKPDHYIAAYNLSQISADSRADFYYISDLSSDAAPVIDKYLRENNIADGYYLRPAWVFDYNRNNQNLLIELKDFRKFNLSKFLASKCSWFEWYA